MLIVDNSGMVDRLLHGQSGSFSIRFEAAEQTQGPFSLLLSMTKKISSVLFVTFGLAIAVRILFCDPRTFSFSITSIASISCRCLFVSHSVFNRSVGFDAHGPCAAPSPCPCERYSLASSTSRSLCAPRKPHTFGARCRDLQSSFFV